MTVRMVLWGISLTLVICMILGAGCLNAFDSDQAASLDRSSPVSAGSPQMEPVITTDNCSPVTITQTDGTQATLSCHPKRIIVANANAAEMMIAIGAADKIVGVTQSTTNVSYIMDKIPQAENIGDWQIPNVEKILSLHPDLVIAYASSKPKNIDQLAAANVTVFYLDCYRLSTLSSDVRALGSLMGRSDEAEVYARTVEDTIAGVIMRVKKIPRTEYPSIYSEMYSDYTVAGPDSGSDEQLTLAGGENIASDVTTPSAKISTEWVISRKPDFIFKVISSTNPKSFSEIHNSIITRTGWKDIPAVKNDRVFLFANDVHYGPRAYIGLVYMAQILHPDELRDLHPQQMLDEYAERYVSGTNTTMMVYP